MDTPTSIDVEYSKSMPTRGHIQSCNIHIECMHFRASGKRQSHLVMWAKRLYLLRKNAQFSLFRTVKNDAQVCFSQMLLKMM